jgi:hypothetical protein
MTRPRRQTLANSFSYLEVKAFLEFHDCVMRGGDARQIARHELVLRMVRKFTNMRAKHDSEPAATVQPTAAP